MNALLLSLSLAANAPTACPPAQVLKLDVDAWVKRAKAAKSIADLQAALGQAGLTEFNKDANGEFAAATKVERILVDAFSTALTDKGGPARVLQVLAVVTHEVTGKSNEVEWELQRGAVLLPLSKDSYCKVDSTFLDLQGSGWGPALCMPSIFGFEKLTSNTHSVIRLNKVDSWCGTAGSDRGEDHRSDWFEVQNFQLVNILGGETLSSHYRSPTPPIAERVTTYEMLGKGFPKHVQRTQTATCQDPQSDDADVKEEFTRCKASVGREQCDYQGGKYVCVPSK
jgi:hypothetical protein